MAPWSHDTRPPFLPTSGPSLWFLLLLSSPLSLTASPTTSPLSSSSSVQALPPVASASSCPRRCSCPVPNEVHCTFRHLPVAPRNLPRDTQRVNLGYNSLTKVEGSEFSYLRQLEMLMLHGNDISTVSSGAFYSLRSLQILKLSYNKLSSLSPGVFEGLVGLVRLHLDHNLIQFIEPYSFNGLVSLKLLQLEGNLLTDLHPHSFTTLSLLGTFWTSGLKHLFLADNLLQTLPAATLQSAARLEVLTLHGNPWTCDCQVHWMLDWSKQHEGVIKCKKDRNSSSSETCAQCSTPQPLNGSYFLGLTPDQIPCERPVLQSPLKQSDSPGWADPDAEPDLPYTRDLQRPLGHLTFVLSDSHGNTAHVACEVLRPGDSSSVAWESVGSLGELSVNVTVATQLECEINRDALQNLWRLVAYYYDSPAVLERGQRPDGARANATTFQYAQGANEESPYFTDLRGHLTAQPSWLLQPRVTLRLNRPQTTTKKLVMDFTTVVSRHVSGRNLREEEEGEGADVTSSWALIRRGSPGRIRTVLEGSKVHLNCELISSGSEVKVEWMLPDLTILELGTSERVEVSEGGELVILNATASDSGLYHCLVRTRAALDLLPVRLTVRERLLTPAALNGKKMTVEVGGSLSLPCHVTSAQPSLTSWYLPGNRALLPTQQTSRVSVSDNGTLLLKKATQDDAGEYSCLASNLYGVDMLSHRVVVTGGKDSDRSTVETQREESLLLVGEGEGEGSGVGYQEIKRDFATQSPKRVGGTSGGVGLRPYPKGKRIKDTKRKPNKSVKEVDPNRWAEMLAKANAKAPTLLPTVLPLTELATVVVITEPTKPVTAPKPTLTTMTTTTAQTTAAATAKQRMEHNSEEEESDSKLESSDNGGDIVPPLQRRPLVQSPGRKVPLVHQNRGVSDTNSVTDHPVTRNSQSVTQSENSDRYTGEGRLNSKGNSGWLNRRRPPYRRGRPPIRRVHPNKPQTTSPPTTTPTTTTTTTTTFTTTLIADEEEEEYLDSYSYEYVDTTTEAMPTTVEPAGDEDEAFPSPDKPHLTVPLAIPKLDTMPYPTDVTKQEEERRSEKERRKDVNNNGNVNIGVTDIRQTVRDRPRTSPNMETGNTASDARHVNSRPPFQHDIVTMATAVITRDRGSENKKAEEWEASDRDRKKNMEGKVEDPGFALPPPVPLPVHPWFHSNNNNLRQGESENPLPLTPPPFTPHQHHRFPNLQGPRPGSLPASPTHQPGPLPHLQREGLDVTNRPQITAETVRPTVRVSSSVEFELPSGPHHHGHNRNPYGPQNRDHLMLSKLRDRYRQAQLDRIAQLGKKVVTPKPRVSYPSAPKPGIASHTPKPHLRYPLANPTPRRQNPAEAPKHKSRKPAAPNPSSSFFYPFPTAFYRPLTTLASFQNGGRWPHGRTRQQGGGFLRPTALPPLPRIMGNGGRGEGKPRITTVTSASVSALAESDLFLPCEASGDPTPSVSWTKVSTGATIPANTKHGSRFEVLVNGTFVIRNIQLQDRGQYLCTAHNSLGSDRMVVTLAVRTQPPKILNAGPSDVAVYLDRAVSLDCLASGKPPAQISWILPDRTFVREAGPAQTRPLVLLANGTLRIQSVSFADKGQYKCIASNAAGADTLTYTLRVAALPPSFDEGGVERVSVPPGRSVYVHCSPKGEPPPTLRWTLPSGVHVKPSQFLGRRFFVFPNGTLHVRHAAPEDSGRYECSASNAVGVMKRTLHLEVGLDAKATGAGGLPSPRQQVPPPPAAPALPIPLSPYRPSQRQGGPQRPSQQHRVSAMYGSTVFLHCPESKGNPRGTMWQLPSKTLLEHRYSPERPARVFPNGTLRILQLTEVDGGNYLCLFQQPNGEDMELFQVEVLMTPPRIEHLGSAQTRVPYGDNFRVDCVATGLPDPEVTWSLPDGTMINNALQSDDSGLRSRRYVIFDNGTLLLQQMGKKDEGEYTCYAKNRLGEVERKVSVRVGPEAPRITPKDHRAPVRARQGEAATLTCHATGDPPPSLTWISPSNEVVTPASARYQLLSDGTLVVKRVSGGDEGEYVCVARNAAGEDVLRVRLEVEASQPLINGARGRSTAKVLAVSYQTTLLDCPAEGQPTPRITWTTPSGLSLATPYLGGRFQVHGNGSLELRGVRRSDEGSYVCLARNSYGEALLAVHLEVSSLAEKPSFASPNIEILPIKQDGGDVVLECPARGKPLPEFTWILPNGTVLSPTSRLSRFTHHPGNGTLRISRPVPTDKGVYRCVARNVAGQAEKRYSLEAGRKPMIRSSAGGMKITYGQSLSLPCVADGWPRASISWTLPNGLVLDKAQLIGRVAFLANGTLQLREVATFDRGTYLCRASNAFGSATLSYPVAVMVYPPRITSTPASVTRVPRGSPVALDCLASGIPKPDITWTLPGRTTLVPRNRFTVQGGGVHMTEEGRLVIQEAMLMHSGIYKCNAKNALGTDFKATYLQVV